MSWLQTGAVFPPQMVTTFEEISIPETHSPFGNCIPVGELTKRYFYFMLQFDKFFLKKNKKKRAHLQEIVKLQQF